MGLPQQPGAQETQSVGHRLRGIRLLGVANSPRLACRETSRRRRMNHCRTVAIDEVLKFRVQEVRSEVVLLHFLECLLRGPAFFRHPIDRRHNARAMATAYTMNVDGLPG